MEEGLCRKVLTLSSVGLSPVHEKLCFSWVGRHTLWLCARAAATAIYGTLQGEQVQLDWECGK